MKKVLLALVMAVSVISAKAQTTMNVRAGGGYNTEKLGGTGIFQVNVPFRDGSRWTFSPSLQLDMAHNPWDDHGSQNILLPLCLGYKIKLGNGLLFPKLGPAVGYDIFSDSGLNTGISAECAYEYKHFVVALNGYSSFDDVYRVPDWSVWDGYLKIYSASLTLGYKF